ncbi:MAG: hypothetical protein KBF26_12485 [Opitutaceae bacterium]|nr:hypothetical protein [Opitutaceae bacterium]
MKPRHLSLLALALLAGCSTIDSRIKEKSALFAGVDAATQEKLRQGTVEINYTPDMVYIALGKPDDKLERITAAGREFTWIYSSYTQEYAGTGVVGHRRTVVYDPLTKSYQVFWEPVVTDVYRNRVDDRIRVTFHDGRVSVIEQVKD